MRLIYPFLFIFLAGCAGMKLAPSYNTAHSRTFVVDYSAAWSAALVESVSLAAEIQQNRDLGTIQTSWINNTNSRNFLEAFKAEDYYRRARYRLFISLQKQKINQKHAVTILIQKEQQVEKSPFAGWETIESTGTEEAAYLYRIGRLIALQSYLDKSDEEASKSLTVEF